MAPGVTQDQVNFYVDLFKKVIATPEWKKFMADGAFNQTFMSGKEFDKWLDTNAALHKQLMQEAGFSNPHLKKLSFGICTIYCGSK
jgi:tripartite-type tricarboxylate transporter receptor subunit TctC